MQNLQNQAIINVLNNEVIKEYDEMIKKKQRILRNPLFMFDRKFRSACRQNLGLNFYNRGKITKNPNDHTMAIEEYKIALRNPAESSPGDLLDNIASAYSARGNIAKVLGNHKSAIEDYTSAIQERSKALPFLVEPSKQGSRLSHQGGVYLERGDLTSSPYDYTSAIRELTKSLGFPASHRDQGLRQGSLARAFYGRGLLTNSSEDFTSAIQAYSTALQFPASPAEQGIRQLNLGAAFSQRGSITNSLEDFASAREAYRAALRFPFDQKNQGILQSNIRITSKIEVGRSERDQPSYSNAQGVDAGFERDRRPYSSAAPSPSTSGRAYGSEERSYSGNTSQENSQNHFVPNDINDISERELLVLVRRIPPSRDSQKMKNTCQSIFRLHSNTQHLEDAGEQRGKLFLDLRNEVASYVRQHRVSKEPSTQSADMGR